MNQKLEPSLVNKDTEHMNIYNVLWKYIILLLPIKMELIVQMPSGQYNMVAQFPFFQIFGYLKKSSYRIK